MIGTTKNTAANTDRPAAVLRSSAPRPRPMKTVTARYSDAPAIPQHPRVGQRDRRTAASGVQGRRREEVGDRGQELTGSTSPASTTSFAHSTGSRDGTTASVARIIPVAYSPLNASTPSTPSTSWANTMPTRLTDTPPRPGWPPRYGTASLTP